VQVERAAGWERLRCLDDADAALAHLRALQINVHKYVAEPVEFAKVDEHEQIVFGWFNVSLRSDGELVTDLQGDQIAPHELEKAAYTFVLESREGGEMHKGAANATLIETMVFTPDKLKAMGLPADALPARWWGGMKIHDPDTFAKVLNGKLRMFSIEGKARRVEV
jgi:hypothetical protein